jgi:molecular chaperone DnaK
VLFRSILNVSARDKGTGKEQKITITASSGLSKDEVERMVREAEKHAAEDAKHREEVEIKNTADTLVYTAEKTLREHGGKVSADLKQRCEDRITKVKAALQRGNADEIRREMQELSDALQQIGSSVYQSQQQPGGGETPPGGEEPPKGDGGTVEGEFREV